MTQKQRLLLAKLLVAISWIDKEIHPNERKTVEELVGSRTLGLEDKLELDLYFEYPLTSKEFSYLLSKIKEEFQCAETLGLLMAWVKKLIKADDVIEKSEVEIFNKVQEVLSTNSKQKKKLNLSRFINQNRFQKVYSEEKASQGRERHLKDYLDNPIYFKVYTHLTLLDDSKIHLNFNKEKLRKLCLGLALFILVIKADEEIESEEIEEVLLSMYVWMGVSSDLGEILMNIAINVDDKLMNLHRVCKVFCKETSARERLDFLEMLRAVTVADGEVSTEEIIKIKEIGEYLQFN